MVQIDVTYMPEQYDVIVITDCDCWRELVKRFGNDTSTDDGLFLDATDDREYAED